MMESTPNPNSPKWMQDPALHNIDKKKLELLHSVISKSENLNQKEKMNLFMDFIKTSKQENLTFSSQELSLLVSTIKRYSTPEEVARMDKILSEKTQ